MKFLCRIGWHDYKWKSVIYRTRPTLYDIQMPNAEWTNVKCNEGTCIYCGYLKVKETL